MNSDDGLRLLDQGPTERTDAARNRRKLLAAAERIVATKGVDALTMNAVAAEAGVGVGTVYRRFNSTSDLAWALIDARGREFQEGFLDGPPPLGPGAAPLDRIRAFLHAYVDLLDYAPQIMAIAESRALELYATGPYRLHRTHLAQLIGEIRPGADAGYLADALLAVLRASLFVHQREHLGMSTDDIKAGLDELLAGFE